MKNKKSRVITILLILVAIFSVGFPLCTMNRIILPIEKYKIENNANDIIEESFFSLHSSRSKERLVDNSLEIHAIESFDGEAMMLFSLDTKSLRPEDEKLDETYHYIALFSLMKVHSQIGYELTSGGSMSIPYPLAPVNSCNRNHICYGTINDDTITKIEIEYSSGDIISHELNGDNYYLFKEPKATGFNRQVMLRAYDKDDNMIYKIGTK